MLTLSKWLYWWSRNSSESSSLDLGIWRCHCWPEGPTTSHGPHLDSGFLKVDEFLEAIACHLGASSGWEAVMKHQGRTLAAAATSHKQCASPLLSGYGFGMPHVTGSGFQRSPNRIQSGMVRIFIGDVFSFIYICFFFTGFWYWVSTLSTLVVHLLWKSCKQHATLLYKLPVKVKTAVLLVISFSVQT